jgi:hypothetical protein
MATKTITTYVDDLDGTDANETVKFGLDGTAYEIDLNDENATWLRDSLAKFVGAGRKVRAKRGRKAGEGAAVATPRATAGGSGEVATKRQRNQAIREWAAQAGWEVPARGRIAKEIVEAYEAAHPAAEQSEDAVA